MSLRELRLKRGMTQEQLAEKVDGVNRARIAAFENNIRPIENMSLGTALRFCDALKISNPRKLLDDSEPSKEQVSDR
ncbi:helix-turn-helix transcriptional regulator [Bifidobacterium simiarum]|uniref:Transcriptional regulator n=1 Tax=Bifidobacterium simiarum TaxID=2045441 RepID=A0A2M9HD45_9BIFI|nr:helix-turn-helix transcriptional regulator [Bifidobacterium simiarum]PJM74722.1 transcriptional regulator [Bifidobacterium simiarum]